MSRFGNKDIANSRGRSWLRLNAFFAFAVLVVSACQGAAAEPAPTATPKPEIVPMVSVADQEIVDNTVTIAEVVSEGPGWLVIHAQAEGKPGPILGFSPVADGANQNVTVEIKAANATETLFAMLHVDAGEAGVFEFPDSLDGPVSVDGKVVTLPFKVGGNPGAGQGARGSTIVYRIVPGESEVTYEVGEVFLEEGNRFNLAVGGTDQVEGEITLDLSAPQAATLSEVQVDISQFSSDSSRRDRALRDRFLQSVTFPISTFVPTKIDGLPATYTPGEEIMLVVTGDLTVREITKPATFEVTVRADSERLAGVAETTILMSDYEVGPISIAGILNTEDEVKLTFTFVARP